MKHPTIFKDIWFYIGNVLALSVISYITITISTISLFSTSCTVTKEVIKYENRYIMPNGLYLNYLDLPDKIKIVIPKDKIIMVEGIKFFMITEEQLNTCVKRDKLYMFTVEYINGVIKTHNNYVTKTREELGLTTTEEKEIKSVNVSLPVNNQ